MCSHENCLIKLILMSTHKIPLSVKENPKKQQKKKKKKKKNEIIPNTIKSAAMGFFFVMDSRMSSK